MFTREAELALESEHMWAAAAGCADGLLLRMPCSFGYTPGSTPLHPTAEPWPCLGSCWRGPARPLLTASLPHRWWLRRALDQELPDEFYEMTEGDMQRAMAGLTRARVQAEGGDKMLMTKQVRGIGCCMVGGTQLYCRGGGCACIGGRLLPRGLCKLQALPVPARQAWPSVRVCSLHTCRCVRRRRPSVRLPTAPSPCAPACRTAMCCRPPSRHARAQLGPHTDASQPAQGMPI